MRDISNADIKKIGIGTVSLIISILSVMFSFTYVGQRNIGEYLLNVIGVAFPIPIISIILFCISIFLGYKYKNNYGAEFGKNLSITFLILIILFSIVRLVSRI